MGAIVPFHRTGSGDHGPSRASGREGGQLLPSASLKGDYEPSQTSCSYLSRRLQQGPLKGHPLPPSSEILRQTHQHIAEAWALRAESRRIQRDYEARQRKIEVLLAGIPADVERA